MRKRFFILLAFGVCLALAGCNSAKPPASPAPETAAGSSAPRIYVTNEVSGDLSVIDSGTRKVIAICEVTGVEGDMILMQDIFLFDRTGIDESGKVRGIFHATGVRPKFADRLATGGYRLRPALFDSKLEI